LGPGFRIGDRLWWSPYQLLLAVVPGLSSVRLPLRFVVIVQLGLALLAGIGFARVASFGGARLRWASSGVVVLAAWLSFSRPPLPLHAELTGDAVPGAYRWLGEHTTSGALLELPSGDFPLMARRMYFSTYHWLPTIGGYSGYAP